MSLQSRLRRLKGSKKGHRCFIVGNGPSLAETPMDLLVNEYTFGMNKISDWWTVLHPSSQWRPTYYVAVGNSAIMWKAHTIAAVRAITEPGVASFVRDKFIPHLFRSSGGAYAVPKQTHPIRVEFWHPDPEYDEDMWSWDIAKRVNKDGSSAFAAQQIAAYMGFNPIYMLGCDLGQTGFDQHGDDPNHFHKGYWEGVYELTEEKAKITESHILIGHCVAKAVCDRAGIEIYNATVGGALEVYPRVRLEDIL